MAGCGVARGSLVSRGRLTTTNGDRDGEGLGFAKLELRAPVGICRALSSLTFLIDLFQVYCRTFGAIRSKPDSDSDPDSQEGSGCFVAL